MIKTAFKIVLILLITSLAYGDEVIPDYGEDSLPSLNEEIRKTNELIEDLEEAAGKVKMDSSDTAEYLESKVKNSIENDSDDFQLVGDSAAPGNTYYYGTDSGGDKGYHSWPVEYLVTGVSDVDTGTGIAAGSDTTFLSVAKTITSGNTVLLIASGYYLSNASFSSNVTTKLIHGSTTVQTAIATAEVNKYTAFSVCARVTGLSGSVTFTVDGNGSTTATGYGNLVVIEF